MNTYQMCTRCVMDTSDPAIQFDSQGVCNHCHKRDEVANRYAFSEAEKKRRFDSIIDRLKENGRGKEYDCVIGLSGGVDSSYVAYLLAKQGIRSLALHLDNSWDSELAVKNIENIVSILNIDLYTHVIDWDEFRDLQLAFLKASTPDSEIPSDHAIAALLYNFAIKEKLKYVVMGCNHQTESHVPRHWSNGYSDWTYIRAVHEQFGRVPLKTFPHYTQIQRSWWIATGQLRIVNILDYINYDKKNAMQELESELGWRNYGGKHFESLYTRFYQGHILPVKFGFDKRRSHFSSQICAGTMSREDALNELANPPYPLTMQETDRQYAVKKLNLSDKDFDLIMRAKPKTYWDYPNEDYYDKRWYQWAKKVYYKIHGNYS